MVRVDDEFTSLAMGFLLDSPPNPLILAGYVCRVRAVGGEMKKFAMIIVVPLVLTACARPMFESDELTALKPACTNGQWEACAEIGHTVRRERAEAAYLAQAQ
jgi:hypothetical protein